MAISMLKIRRPLGRLIFNMGIAISGKTVFLIETAPWAQSLVEHHRKVHFRIEAKSNMVERAMLFPVAIYVFSIPHDMKNTYIMCWKMCTKYSDGLVQDCSISNVLMMEILQSCAKLLTYLSWSVHWGWNKMAAILQMKFLDAFS